MIERFSGCAVRLLIGISLVVLAMGCSRDAGPSIPAPTEDSPAQRAMVDEIGVALAPVMESRTPREALLVELENLYAPLDPSQRAFLDAIRNLEGADPDREVETELEWIPVEGQRVASDDGEQTIPLQLLPREVWQAYHVMNEAMKADLGSGLAIGSGYRSPANQLFIFVRYMPYYAYSVDQTKPHVSLPGASDHNRVERQGIDFVSESGVDLRYSDAAAFRALPQHAWLLENGPRFGFEGEGPTSQSPWHWHFAGATNPTGTDGSAR